jgi:phosphoribosylanthranilate isomerase
MLKNERVTELVSERGILGVVVDYSALTNTLASEAGFPIYIAGELTVEQLEEIRDNEGIAGVILSGGIEERPGFKNMDDLIDALEVFEE